ncbi:MAG: toprim domain-containing protein [Synergistaceae bacterium]|nr:toprim domain-containing protein [Synergistaceae bacterium]
MKNSANDIARMIREKWSVLSYCRDVLGLPVYHDGDRCVSPLPTRCTDRADAFIVHEDWWYDFSQTKGGDVIALCAEIMHNGDRGEAFRELGQEFYGGVKASSYTQHAEALTRLIGRWHKALRPQDREYLHERRITDETIDRLQMGYCGDPKSGFYDRIIIPYWDNGQVVYYAGRDCSGKWKDKSSGVSKYKKMWTGKNEYSENTMWGLHTLRHDWCDDPVKDEYLCILEGQFDAMSFEQERWHVLSPIGGRFAGKLLPIVKSICKGYKKVFICFDNDGPGISFQRFMAQFLFESGIPFVCGHVQHMYGNTAIKDVSDYYTLGGDLAQLVMNASDGMTDLAASFTEERDKEFLAFMKRIGRYLDTATITMFAKRVKLPEDFVKECVKIAKKPPLESDIAAEILKAHNILYMVNDGYYEYEHGVWNVKPGVAVQGYAADVLGNYAVSGRMISLMRHVAAKRWNDGQYNTQNVINFSNGVLDMETMTFGGHSPSYMSSIQLTRCYDPDARCDTWLRVLGEITEGREDKMRLLQQMAGYIFWPDNRLETAFILKGSGSNGKSVIIETLRYVLDPRNCSEVDLSKMGDNFAPMALRNSLVNFCTETNVDLKASESAIKKVISGETIMAAHKGVDAVAFVPRCKLWCSCNTFMASKDTTYAFMRRLKIMEFSRTFTASDKDTGLRMRLRDEAAGILNWMIAGSIDLRRSNGFVRTSEESQLREDFLVQANPLAGFILEKMTRMQGKYFTSELYKLYETWAKDGNVGVMSKPNFSRVLRDLMKQIMPQAEYSRSGGSHYIMKPSPVNPTDATVGDDTL